MTNYSIDAITTIEACDTALVQTRRQRKILQWKIDGLDLQLERIAEITKELTSSIRSLETVLWILEQRLQSLPPDSKDARASADEKIRVQHTIYLRQQRLQKYPPEKLVVKELELQKLAASLELQSLVVLQLEAHRVLLQKKTEEEATAAMEETKSIMYETPVGTASTTEPVVFKIAVDSRAPARFPARGSGKISDA